MPHLNKGVAIYHNNNVYIQRELWSYIFLRSPTQAPTIKAVRGPVAIKGIFNNAKGLGSCYRVRSPYMATSSPYGGSVPLTGLFSLCCATVCVFGVCNLLSGTFLKMVVWVMVRKWVLQKTQLGRKKQNIVFVWKQHSTTKKGFKILGGMLCPSKHNIAKKTNWQEEIDNSPKSMRTCFWSKVGVLKVCWSVFSRVLGVSGKSLRAKGTLN